MDRLVIGGGASLIESIHILIRAGAAVDLTSEIMMGEGNELAVVLYNNLPAGTLATMIIRLAYLMEPGEE